MYALFHDNYQSERWHVFIAYLLCSWISASTVIFGHHLLPFLNQVGLFWVCVGGFVTVIAVAVMPSTTGNGYASSHQVWAEWQNDTGYSSNGFVFLLGLLNGAFALGVPGLSHPQRLRFSG
jgi:choline transport protein